MREMIGLIVYYWVICLGFLVHIVVLRKGYVKEHEMAHAKKARELGYKTFVVLKDVEKSEKEYVGETEGIRVYHVSKERFHKYYAKTVGGVAIYDGKVYDEKGRKITKAGPKESTKLVAKTTIIWLVLGGFITYFCCKDMLLIVLSVLALMGVIICASFWKFSRKSLDRFEIVIKEKIANEDKDRLLPSVSDGTKLRYGKRYTELTEMIWEHPEFFTTYEEILERFKDLEDKYNKENK